MSYQSLTIQIEAATGVSITDREHPDMPCRVVNLNLGWITFMVGWDDLDRIAILDRVIAAAMELRANAAARIAEAAEPVAECHHCGAGGSTPHWVDCPERRVTA